MAKKKTVKPQAQRTPAESEKTLADARQKVDCGKGLSESEQLEVLAAVLSGLKI